MLAFTRTHCPIANSAASRAERHHSIGRPSGSGSRTGHRNTTRCRLMAVNNVLQANSPASSGKRSRATMYCIDEVLAQAKIVEIKRIWWWILANGAQQRFVCHVGLPIVRRSERDFIIERHVFFQLRLGELLLF